MTTTSAVLEDLLAGNDRFKRGHSMHEAPSSRLAALSDGQRPWAIILACSDSRVALELVFDATLGDLFVIRIAGNFADTAAIGSIEFAVQQFASPLLLVLGHSGCGAVGATLENVRAGSPALPGNIGDIVRAIEPSARIALKAGGDVYADAVAENVRATVAKLLAVSPIIATAAQTGALQVVGGIYDIKTGTVHMLG